VDGGAAGRGGGKVAEPAQADGGAGEWSVGWAAAQVCCAVNMANPTGCPLMWARVALELGVLIQRVPQAKMPGILP